MITITGCTSIPESQGNPCVIPFELTKEPPDLDQEVGRTINDLKRQSVKDAGLYYSLKRKYLELLGVAKKC